MLHPILVASVGGLLLGNLSAGVSIGLIFELIWGSNLFDYEFGLQYVNLATILTVILTLVTGNISLLASLTLALIISYSLQELVAVLYQKVDRSWLVEVVIFLFILTLMNFIPVWKSLLGLIPAQFLDQLAVAGGLLPGLGLAVILAQTIAFNPLQNGIKSTYFLAVLIATLFSLYIPQWVPVIFLVSWGVVYLLLSRSKITISLLRFIIGGMVIIIIPLVVEMAGPLVDSQLKFVLWSEGFVSLFALVLLLFRVTQFELYFLVLILGVVLSRVSLLL